MSDFVSLYIFRYVSFLLNFSITSHEWPPSSTIWVMRSTTICIVLKSFVIEDSVIISPLRSVTSCHLRFRDSFHPYKINSLIHLWWTWWLVRIQYLTPRRRRTDWVLRHVIFMGQSGYCIERKLYFGLRLVLRSELMVKYSDYIGEFVLALLRSSI